MTDEAIYRIRVAGRLGPEWSARLAGMSVAVDDEPHRATTTVLTGPLPDQAALMGTLDQLHCLGATVLTVERQGPAGTNGSPDGPHAGTRHAS